MAERTVIIPPEYLRVEKQPIIFLAGPIQGAPDWQLEAVKFIHDLTPGILIASPRRVSFDKGFNYDEQVDWETHYLNEAGEKGVIMFWLAKEKEVVPGRAYAQTSRFELAEWKVRHQKDGVKLVIGIEEGFPGERYIRKRLTQDCPDVLILDTLEKTCAVAINLLKKDSL